MSGGKIVVIPSKTNRLKTKENTIIGNTVLYGATSGTLFAAGKAGERFAVRNSGGNAIVEGCDSNGCEYMTGGNIVILGSIGDNFGAGMTGGMAFIYDPENTFENFVNPASVTWQKPETKYWKEKLKSLIQDHLKETNSAIAKEILDDFENKINHYLDTPEERVAIAKRGRQYVKDNHTGFHRCSTILSECGFKDLSKQVIETAWNLK